MLKVANSVINASQITGVLPVANGGTNASSASITSFNNITGYTAAGATGTTSTNLVFSASPTFTGTVAIATLNVSQPITTTYSGTYAINSTSAGTGPSAINFYNTGANLIAGVEGSTGGALVTGSTAYAVILASYVNKPIQFGVNDTVRTTISATGLAVTGALSCTGALSKGSGSFRVSHPLPELNETHQLVHSFIEGPQADLIYRGKIALVAGSATINIDTVAGMTDGTFEVLCRDVQCFTSNESGWNHVRGSVTKNKLTIKCQDQTSTDLISWMVIGERKDPHMYETDWTDENGKVIVEPLKSIEAQAAE